MIHFANRVYGDVRQTLRKVKGLPRALLLVFSALCVWGKTANEVLADAYKFESIGREEGMLSLKVLKVYQQHNGYMWFGEDSGAARYDGRNFVNDQLGSANRKITGNVITDIIEQPDIVEIVREALEVSNLEPKLLELEITESVLLENGDVTRAVLKGFKDLGVIISLDDFGTGFSCLSYLTEFDFDTLKIDRAFLMNVEEDPRKEEVIKSIVGLAIAWLPM